MPGKYRVYATLRTTETLLARYRDRSLRGLRDFTLIVLDRMARRAERSALIDSQFDVVSAPSLDWQPHIAGHDFEKEAIPAELVVAYAFDRLSSAEEFVSRVHSMIDESLDAENTAFLDIGADVGGGLADHWCPGPADQAIFRHRAAARRLIQADTLKVAGWTGKHVNVVILDQGIDRLAFPAKNWGGGFGPNAGTAPRTSHGTMVARNILNIAPDAVVYDAPFIPPRIDHVLVFASMAHAVYSVILLVIDLLRLLPQWNGPWILVNAWAILDRATDTPPFGSYTENNAVGGHPLIKQIAGAVAQRNLDTIFAAGNSGEFCPNPRSGATDRGPGHSIWGCNALPQVITPGAVRTDETWLGYSSQGPGPGVHGLASKKPDLCAPSQFIEDGDASTINSGTSAACAVTAGVVAALRSNPAWAQHLVHPAILQQALIDGARQLPNPGWNNRTGWGILNAAGAMAKLPP